MKTKYSSIGEENLLTLAKANNFTQWLYSEIKPFLKGNILEIGSGLGTYSEKICHDFPKSQITLSDIDQKFIINLKRTFKSFSKVKVIKLNLNKKNDLNKLRDKFDSILLINVLEHIKDDLAALNNLANLLKPKGKIIILVPAHKFLFNCIDVEVGHYRRYNLQELKSKISQKKISLYKIFYFNFMPIFAWYLIGTILKNSSINEKAMGFYDKMVPSFKFIENKIFKKRFGISLIAILEK